MPAKYSLPCAPALPLRAQPADKRREATESLAGGHPDDTASRYGTAPPAPQNPWGRNPPLASANQELHSGAPRPNLAHDPLPNTPLLTTLVQTFTGNRKTRNCSRRNRRGLCSSLFQRLTNLVGQRLHGEGFLNELHTLVKHSMMRNHIRCIA